MSVSGTKTSGWSKLQISLYGSKQVTKDWSYLVEIIIMYSRTTTRLFGNTNVVTNRQKEEIPMNLLTNEGSKIVDEVGEIPGAG